ncbi:MAG: endonuclease domain-containing protein [Ignavibacterium sp.]|jgi:very-short-patch-repair endonuclease|nr:endonuclease domain-containing protein [Ignavibacterium album]MDT3697499.1 endonuclease domain-containing protein [Ignavibacterium sp.]
MSLNKKGQLREVAKFVCRELRKKSTEAEQIMWKFLRNRNMEGRKFLRQHPLFYDLTGKDSFFVADFYCHEERLIIELDGEYHKYRITEDIIRSNIINNLGIRVIRFKNEEVLNDLSNVIKEIKNNLLFNSTPRPFS